MKRLTKKLNQPYENICGLDYVYTSDSRLTPSFASVEQKLGQLEDIEEELGIDFVTLFKALKQKYVYVKNEGNNQFKVKLCYNDKMNDWFLWINEGWLSTEDYGKTWALTKEELL